MVNANFYGSQYNPTQTNDRVLIENEVKRLNDSIKETEDIITAKNYRWAQANLEKSVTKWKDCCGLLPPTETRSSNVDLLESSRNKLAKLRFYVDSRIHLAQEDVDLLPEKLPENVSGSDKTARSYYLKGFLHELYAENEIGYEMKEKSVLEFLKLSEHYARKKKCHLSYGLLLKCQKLIKESDNLTSILADINTRVTKVKQGLKDQLSLLNQDNKGKERSCYIIHDFDDKIAREWIKQHLCPDLTQAGIKVIWSGDSLCIGTSVSSFQAQILGVDTVLVISTPQAKKKIEKRLEEKNYKGISAEAHMLDVSFEKKRRNDSVLSVIFRGPRENASFWLLGGDDMCRKIEEGNEVDHCRNILEIVCALLNKSADGIRLQEKFWESTGDVLAGKGSIIISTITRSISSIEEVKKTEHTKEFLKSVLTAKKEHKDCINLLEKKEADCSSFKKKIELLHCKHWKHLYYRFEHLFDDVKEKKQFDKFSNFVENIEDEFFEAVLNNAVKKQEKRAYIHLVLAIAYEVIGEQRKAIERYFALSKLCMEKNKNHRLAMECFHKTMELVYKKDSSDCYTKLCRDVIESAIPHLENR